MTSQRIERSSKSLNVHQIWKHYHAFESCCRREGVKMDEFLSDWNAKMYSAQSVGCHYSDLVLACKLIEKANISQDLISILDDLNDIKTEEELLPVVLAKLEAHVMEHCEENRSNLNKSEEENFISEAKFESFDESKGLGSFHQECKAIASPDCDSPPTNGSRPKKKPNCPKCLKPLETVIVYEDLDFAAKGDEDLKFAKKGKLVCQACDFVLYLSKIPEEWAPTKVPDEDGLLIKVEPSIEDSFMDDMDLMEKYGLSYNDNELPEDFPPEIRTKKTTCNICEICEKEFDRPCKLKVHMTKMHNFVFPPANDEELDPQDEADLMATVMDSTSERLNPSALNGKEIPYHKCKLCGKRFDRPCKLRTHYVNLHGNTDLMKDVSRKKRDKRLPTVYQCEICGKDFAQRHQLKQHYRKHDREEESDVDLKEKKPSIKKSPICKICGKQFAKLSYYKFHMKCHTGEKNYTCDECSASFIHYFSLIYHKRKHTGERKFKCEECTKEYYTSGSLKMHIRREHLKERPYKCDHCNYTSANKGNLKRHLMSHTDERPYKCDNCEKAFKDAKSRKRHAKSHLQSNMATVMNTF